MKYFTYKLKWMAGNGYQPKQSSYEDWLDCGYLPQGDVRSNGTLMGYSTRDISDSFTSDIISDYNITEINYLTALQRSITNGYLNTILGDDGKLILQK